MSANSFLGVVFHWLGGLAAGSFYVPYRAVRNWAWETYWLVGGVFSWIVAPWALALAMTCDLPSVLSQTPRACLLKAYFCGVMWGVGGLTFGLTMRYLGMSLGMAVALGYCTAFGTLVPPIYRGEFVSHVWQTASGRTILIGVAVCLAGIALSGVAGTSKEHELEDAQKKLTVREFNFKKGLWMGTFSGVMSSFFSFGLAAGDPIKELTIAHGTRAIWQGLPVLVVVLFGGFTTNFFWCLLLNLKNRTGYQYFSATRRPAADGEFPTAPSAPRPPSPVAAPMLRNYAFCALAGGAWYFQFFFYTMGESQMERYKFSSWTIHMASVIIFSSLWGIGLCEWKGTSSRTKRFLAAGLTTLIFSTMIVGYGNYLGATKP